MTTRILISESRERIARVREGDVTMEKQGQGEAGVKNSSTNSGFESGGRDHAPRNIGNLSLEDGTAGTQILPWSLPKE